VAGDTLKEMFGLRRVMMPYARIQENMFMLTMTMTILLDNLKQAVLQLHRKRILEAIKVLGMQYNRVEEALIRLTEEFKV
jgi:hypothetical protein